MSKQEKAEAKEKIDKVKSKRDSLKYRLDNKKKIQE